MAWLAAVLLVALFDEVGLADVAILVLTSVPLALRIKNLNRFAFATNLG
ncbi:MAG TPA: hypothetical protein VF885_00425 [Arthrobacter sp.]